ncbi:holo-ACP synthase [Coprothermobacteraceae bacterium]|nr:holo-ACP synthase [Coprothermobacteraceae bacterium]
MIRGVGIDIVSLERFRKTYRKHGKRLLEAVFCQSEWNLAAESLGARFAAKEAVIKALGRPDIPMRCICIDSPAAEARIRCVAVEGRVLVSISHERDVAVAVAIWEA